MRGRFALLLACVGLLLATAWYAGAQSDPGRAGPSTGTVRLGPEPGEDVVGYLTRLPADLPAPGETVLALVQFGSEATPGEAVAVLGGSPAVSVVFHVPLPRVQTALRFVPLDPGSPAADLDRAREQARFAADADATRRTGRPADVAAVEAAALADPACRCVLAVLVRADRAGLDAVAARDGVRAVHTAPAGAVAAELALAPLLPDQRDRADPVPDDGLVPAR
ncbi:MAG: hypothetical protein ACT4RN_13370 [Pseudonocardia sp.]